MSKKNFISIIILVYNEQFYLEKLLVKLLQFSNNYSIEIIIIDSSSTDNSISIEKKYSDQYPTIVKLYVIKKERFHFAETRNWGIRKARGEYIIFLSADALPLSDKFFEHFLEDFKLNDRVMAVFGQHIPYPNTPFIQKIEATIKFDILNQYIDKRGLLVFDKKKPFIPYSYSNYYYWWLLSNTFSCYRKDYLVKYPFPNINGYEDMALGKIIVESDLIKIYDSRCKVLHSHNLTVNQYFNKQLEELLVVGRNFKILKPVNIGYKINKILKEKLNIAIKVYLILTLSFYYFIKIIALFIAKFCAKKKL